jgi:hypothetical protein
MAARRPPANHGMPSDDTLSWLGTSIPGFAPAANALTVTGSGRVGSAQQHRPPASRRPSAQRSIRASPTARPLTTCSATPTASSGTAVAAAPCVAATWVHAYAEPGRRRPSPTATKDQTNRCYGLIWANRCIETCQTCAVTTSESRQDRSLAPHRSPLTKVPEVTVYFWIIKGVRLLSRVVRASPVRRAGSSSRVS